MDKFYFQKEIEDKVAELIISDYNKAITAISLKYSKKDDKLIVECI